MPAKLKLHNDILKQEGDELIKFISNSFEIVAERSCIEDELNNFRSYLIYDDRISKDCMVIDIQISSGETPFYIPMNNRLGFYKNKYYAWFDDGTITYPEIKETKTLKQLYNSLDGQLDEYNKHKESGSEICMELTKRFIDDILNRISKLENK